MLEIKLRLHGCAARLLGIPRSEFPDTVNLTARLRVRQDRVKIRGLIESEISHVEMVDVERMRRERRILGQRDDHCIISNDLANHNRKFLCQIQIGAVNQRRPTGLSRRRADLQSVQAHAADRHFVSQQARDVRREGNFRDFDQWWHVCAPVVPQYDTCDHHMDAGLQRNFEILEFKLAVKPEPEVRLRLAADHPSNCSPHREQESKRR